MRTILISRLLLLCALSEVMIYKVLSIRKSLVLLATIPLQAGLSKLVKSWLVSCINSDLEQLI
jgi:hypothetical protein